MIWKQLLENLGIFALEVGALVALFSAWIRWTKWVENAFWVLIMICGLIVMAIGCGLIPHPK